MIAFDTVKIKLNDAGRGSVWIANGETEIELAATTSIRIVARPHAVTYVTIRMLANVEFEGSAALSVERAIKQFPDLYEGDLNVPYDQVRQHTPECGTKYRGCSPYCKFHEGDEGRTTPTA